MTEHTPLRWQYRSREDFGSLHGICGGRNEPISQDITEGNAKFIVRTVNCHEVLVTILKEVLNLHSLMFDVSTPDSKYRTAFELSLHMRKLQEVQETARAALALAEGEKR